ncbi:MAG: hypothetical protein WD154_08030 [Nitrosopumilaceae archaeon]
MPISVTLSSDTERFDSRIDKVLGPATCVTYSGIVKAKDPNSIKADFTGNVKTEYQETLELKERLKQLEEQVSKKIPNWIKNNAKWWADKQIGDADFVQGIQYLITQEIIKIPETKAGSGTSQEIPAWIRNNAKWWADGQISDDDFISGIQYLISSGIMKV